LVLCGWGWCVTCMGVLVCEFREFCFAFVEEAVEERHLG
jgi:hypothetical protein